MVNPYFQPGPQRAPQVRALFAAIANRYDLINDLQSLGLHRYWKHRLLTQAAIQPGHKSLDVCTGTGDIAFRLQAAGAQTFGVDFSLPMLQVALRRSQSLRTPIPLLAADGLHLPFLHDSFDRITIAYGLRNLTDFAAGLHEFHRVTRPGGRLLILDFGKPSHPIWRACSFAYLRLALPLLGRVFCANPHAYAYIAESLHHYPDQQAVAQLLRKTGWQNVKITNFLGGSMSLHAAEKPALSPAPQQPTNEPVGPGSCTSRPRR